VTESSVQTVPRSIAAPDRAPVFALLTAKAISLTGNTLTALAIPWYVLVTTNSAAKTGIVAFAQMFPTVLASFLGGALVDRLGSKRLSVIADVMSGLTVGAVPLLHHTIGLAYWQLLMLVFLGALLDAPGSTAREALLPELAERAAMPLERANAATHVIQSAASLIGPPLAGILIAWLGASNVLWLDAASFALSAAMIGALVPGVAPWTDGAGRFLDEVLDGLRFLRRDRMLSTFLALAAVLNFVGAPLFAVVLPVYTKATYDSPRALGIMIAGFGAGAIGGAIAYGAFGQRYSRWALNVWLLIVASLAFTALVFLPPLVISVVVLAVVGFATGIVNPLISTILQERTPPDLRGRVFGTVGASAMVAAPAGMLLAGGALETAGIRAVLGTIAAVFTAVTVIFVAQPALRDMDRPPASI
jgi:MFS family permease